jgi:hypothetical protein
MSDNKNPLDKAISLEALMESGTVDITAGYEVFEGCIKRHFEYEGQDFESFKDFEVFLNS